jgi:hypothetical protein
VDCGAKVGRTSLELRRLNLAHNSRQQGGWKKDKGVEGERTHTHTLIWRVSELKRELWAKEERVD